MLELKDVEIIIQGNKIISNINYKFYDGFLIIIGPSGSGKSTLLNSILGSQKISKGDILLNGKSIKDEKIIDRNIGIVFQDLVLFPNLTVEQNINVGKNIDNILKNRLIKKFNIEKILRQYPHEISGGEAQRVALIRSLIVKPELLLLDEVFSALDDETKTKIKTETKEILSELKIPTIIVTHDKNDINFFGGKILNLTK